MTWFYVDDHFHDHKKARKSELEAIGMWTRAGSWCADNLTDGFVPASVAPRWTGDVQEAERIAADLVRVGLWFEDEEDGERGWRFHDWADVQKTREEVLSQREKRVAAGRKGGIRSGASRRSQAPEVPPLESPHEQEGSASQAPASSRDQAPPQASAEANASALLEAKSNPVPSRPVLYSDPSDPRGKPAAPDLPTSGTSQDLIGWWIDASAPGRPPGRVTGQLSKELKAMLEQDIPFEDVAVGLEEWHARGLHPSAVASVVHELRTLHARRRPKKAPALVSVRPNTADRVNKTQALKLAQRRSPEQTTPLALGGGNA